VWKAFSIDMLKLAHLPKGTRKSKYKGFPS
jgi:hypothetical protein